LSLNSNNTDVLMPLEEAVANTQVIEAIVQSGWVARALECSRCSLPGCQASRAADRSMK